MYIICIQMERLSCLIVFMTLHPTITSVLFIKPPECSMRSVVCWTISRATSWVRTLIDNTIQIKQATSNDIDIDQGMVTPRRSLYFLEKEMTEKQMAASHLDFPLYPFETLYEVQGWISLKQKGYQSNYFHLSL